MFNGFRRPRSLQPVRSLPAQANGQSTKVGFAMVAAVSNRRESFGLYINVVLQYLERY